MAGKIVDMVAIIKVVIITDTISFILIFEGRDDR